MKNNTETITYIAYGSSALLFIFAGFFAYGYFEYTKLQRENASLNSMLDTTKTSLISKTDDAEKLTLTLSEIQQAYSLSEEKGNALLQLLDTEKNKNSIFEDQISSISGTVGTLDKLSKTDPQLLQKYSKVYFLNENYMPGLVLTIDDEFVFNQGRDEFIHEKVAPFLSNLLNDAKDDGINFLIVSAYRSFDMQKSIKTSYTTQYGSGANTFSADQGYSEHQLGTTVDFTTKETGGSLTGFEKTEAYTWLLKNGYKYGFVLSYPEDNTYYMFEPWHWRYVGVDLAKDLHRSGKYFYNLDQREIDSYLISLFD